MKNRGFIVKRRGWGVLLSLAAFSVHANEVSITETHSAIPKKVHSTLKHDPFQLPAFAREANSSAMMSVSASGDELELRGILLSKNNPMVNINGEILKIGDVIDGYKLLDINAQQAVFEKQKNRITLQLKDNKSTYQ
jgi:hypothetical protein